MPSRLELLTKKLHPDAKLPEKKRNTDEGYDLFSNEDLVVPSGETRKVNTDIACMAMTVTRKTWDRKGEDVEESYEWDHWLQIEGRSGMALKGVFPVGGIVDVGYTGPLGVMLTNNSKEDYEVNKGDKIAQLVPRKHYHFDVKEVNELPETDRGAKGFGSSGR